MTHTAEFTSPLIMGSVVIGAVVKGVSRGFTTRGRLLYETEWSGVYEGIRESEHVEGEQMHCFRDGIIGTTPQKCFAIPVAQFTTEDDDNNRTLDTNEWVSLTLKRHEWEEILERLNDATADPGDRAKCVLHLEMQIEDNSLCSSRKTARSRL